MPTPLQHRLHSIFWAVNRPLVGFGIRRMFNFVTGEGSDPVPGPPYVLVANHANFFDPWMTGYLCHHPLFIMMNDDGFRGNRLRSLYLHTIGAFPKKKGAHDYKAMKYTLQLLKGGFPVLIFPEGQTSWDGETQPVFSGIEKIIKRAQCSLVMMHLHGNFLSKPWWAHTARKGTVVIRVKVLGPAEIASMSDAGVLEAIKSYIYNNDVKNPENRTVIFRGATMAKGLERFVWICKQCKAEDALVTDGNVITCTACSASWEIDPYCVLKPRMPNIAAVGDLHDWVRWHKEQVKARIASSPSSAIMTESTDVVMQTEGPGGTFVDRLTGTLALWRDKIMFTPADSGGRIMEWPFEAVEDYVIQLKDVFEFSVGSDCFRFAFDGHSPMKWIFYVRYMKGYEEIEKRRHY